MSTQIIEIEADSIAQARQKAQEQARHLLGDSAAILHEDILSNGRPQTAEATADTIAEAQNTAVAQLPPNAIIDRSEVRLEPKLVKHELHAHDDQSAHDLVVEGVVGELASPDFVLLRQGQRLVELTLKAAGKKGFLGFGKMPSVYEATILQPAVIVVTFHCKVRMRFQIGTSEDKERDYYKRLAQSAQQSKEGWRLWEEKMRIESEERRRKNREVCERTRHDWVTYNDGPCTYSECRRCGVREMEH